MVNCGHPGFFSQWCFSAGDIQFGKRFIHVPDCTPCQDKPIRSSFTTSMYMVKSIYQSCIPDALKQWSISGHARCWQMHVPGYQPVFNRCPMEAVWILWSVWSEIKPLNWTVDLQPEEFHNLIDHRESWVMNWLGKVEMNEWSAIL